MISIHITSSVAFGTLYPLNCHTNMRNIYFMRIIAVIIMCTFVMTVTFQLRHKFMLLLFNGRDRIIQFFIFVSE